jgi:hypothetical protein
MSADVKSGDLGLVGARGGERSEWGGLPEGPASPVFVVERLELAQGMYEVALVPDQGAVQIRSGRLVRSGATYVARPAVEVPELAHVARATNSEGGFAVGQPGSLDHTAHVRFRGLEHPDLFVDEFAATA